MKADGSYEEPLDNAPEVKRVPCYQDMPVTPEEYAAAMFALVDHPRRHDESDYEWCSRAAECLGNRLVDGGTMMGILHDRKDIRKAIAMYPPQLRDWKLSTMLELREFGNLNIKRARGIASAG